MKTSFLLEVCPMLRVKVPATSANMGPGFDVMGIALQIYNEYSCTQLDEKSENKITISYNGLAKATADVALEKMQEFVPLDKHNLFWKGYFLLFEKLQKKPLRVHIHIDAQIPLTRGLGSSSTVILASMVIANELCKEHYQTFLSKQELLDMAIALEGHPDNLAPAMLGGWVVSIRKQKTKNNNQENSSYLLKQMSLKAPIRFAGIVPHQTLSTETARQVLPSHYPREDVIFQAGNAALYTYLMAKEQWSNEEKEIFSSAIKDVLHEPYRLRLIPGMEETFAHWKKLGCLGAYLSGAGTTLLGIWQKDQNVEELPLGYAMQQKGINSTTIYPPVDLQGLSIERK